MSIRLQLDSDLLPTPNTPDLEENQGPYFDSDYLFSTITAGALWILMSVYSPIVVAVIKKQLSNDSTIVTSGTKNARNILMFGNGTLFALLTTFWLLAYIHTEIMQTIYLHAITWGVPISWAILLASLVEFILGGKQTYKASERPPLNPNIYGDWCLKDFKIVEKQARASPSYPGGYCSGTRWDSASIDSEM